MLDQPVCEVCWGRSGSGKSKQKRVAGNRTKGSIDTHNHSPARPLKVNPKGTPRQIRQVAGGRTMSPLSSVRFSSW